MKNSVMVLFFSVILLIYAAINYYIIHKGLLLIEPTNVWKPVFIATIIFLAAAFILGRLMERQNIHLLAAILIWIGSFWLAIMVYLLLQLLLVDLLLLLNKLLHFIPDRFAIESIHTKRMLAGIISGVTILVVLAGHLNTWFPKVRKMDLTVAKAAGKRKMLKIVAFSDVHLGTLIEKRHLAGIVQRVNSLNPDVILIPGDIIDEDIGPVIRSNVGETLKNLKSKDGVYAVTGNHEYIGGAQQAKDYLKHHGIQILNDTAVLIDDSYYLIGREDLMKNRIGKGERKTLPQIVEGVNKALPLILLDHQPFRLEQAVEEGIDLQLSGHTHHGQLWPFHLITRLVYEKSWGYLKKGRTHFYVSSGVGGWGPPIRTVNRPEIVQINLHFNE
jgi:predicted MPP superfamily phosphohydrolase